LLGRQKDAAMVTQASDAVASALERIAADDKTLQAWAYVEPRVGDLPPVAGLLSGVPFGVKDIIDVARMPTAFGLWREHRRARLDAWCVALLRAVGAVPIGKTRTTAHAWRDPAPTVNPIDHARTPGGSSAGSAAAVAAGHVSFALGTQTMGSVLRPAAYCGVVGFKPTWGRIPGHGVAPVAPSLDHVGVLGRDVAITAQVAHTLMSSLVIEDPVSRPRLGVSRTVYDGLSEKSKKAVQAAIEKLIANGCVVTEETLPDSVATAPAQALTIVAYEAYASLGPLLTHALPLELRGMLHQGEQISRDTYDEALLRRHSERHDVNELIASFDAVIVPCGDAAPSRMTTGDATPFAPWSYFGLPAISIPIPGTAPAALSLQLVTVRGDDARLLAFAATIEAALA
jgi:Asp-tRNA(Asn)/Glu-tRNA(Gln) amidotransferase A subunit family amidase